MISLNDYTVRTRLLFLAVLPIAGLVAVMAASFWAFAQDRQGVRTIYEDRVVPLRQLKKIAASASGQLARLARNCKARSSVSVYNPIQLP